MIIFSFLSLDWESLSAETSERISKSWDAAPPLTVFGKEVLRWEGTGLKDKRKLRSAQMRAERQSTRNKLHSVRLLELNPSAQ